MTNDPSRENSGTAPVLLTINGGSSSVKFAVFAVDDLSSREVTSTNPHGLSDHDFDALFTRNKPVIFAYHGDPWLTTAEPITSTTMFEATRRKARSPRRSTWLSATISTGFISSVIWSIGSRNWTRAERM